MKLKTLTSNLLIVIVILFLAGCSSLSILPKRDVDVQDEGNEVNTNFDVLVSEEYSIIELIESLYLRDQRIDSLNTVIDYLSFQAE